VYTDAIPNTAYSIADYTMHACATRVLGGSEASYEYLEMARVVSQFYVFNWPRNYVQ